LVDLPPGAAADKPPAIVGYIPELDGAIVVTTPSEVTGDVVKKSIIYTRDVGIKVLGIIENMSGFLCPHCHSESELFEGSSDQLCKDLKVQLLGKIPFSREMSRACDQGSPLKEESDYIVQKFDQIARTIANQLKFKMAEK